jgi:hypothetical protein
MHYFLPAIIQHIHHTLKDQQKMNHYKPVQEQQQQQQLYFLMSTQIDIVYD